MSESEIETAMKELHAVAVKYPGWYKDEEDW